MRLALNDDPATSSPAALGSALERLMITQCLPPRFVRRVREITQLPPRLQYLLETLGPAVTWRAFSDGAQWWFGLASQRALVRGNRSNSTPTSSARTPCYGPQVAGHSRADRA